jgi:dihydroorotate dehydrogenase (fumarate)/dihydroorotate dehydrogenase
MSSLASTEGRRAPAGTFYRSVVRPALFALDPERAHTFAIRASSIAARVPGVPRLTRSLYGFAHPSLEQTIAGIHFSNPLGLAAGFDKNGQAVALLGTLGFGHVEIGSISAFPSRGNARPRLFRAPIDRAIIVAYGVPNEGCEAVAARLERSGCPVPLGINLVKTNDASCPNTDEGVLSDYARAFARLQPLASYMNINMSCPNSENDRDFFDDPARVAALFDRLAQVGPRVPVFLKLKPARDPAVFREIVRLADQHPYISGFGINLPSGKPPELVFGAPRETWAHLPGAVSGPPVEPMINANLRSLAEIIGPRSRYTLFAAGGVFTAEDAYRKIRLGASLVQLYTAMIYGGPAVVKGILQGLVELLARDGFRNVSEAVGKDL